MAKSKPLRARYASKPRASRYPSYCGVYTDQSCSRTAPQGLGSATRVPRSISAPSQAPLAPDRMVVPVASDGQSGRRRARPRLCGHQESFFAIGMRNIAAEHASEHCARAPLWQVRSASRRRTQAQGWSSLNPALSCEYARDNTAELRGSRSVVFRKATVSDTGEGGIDIGTDRAGEAQDAT